MSAVVSVIAGIGIVGFVIGRQLLGEPLRGKRVVLLPLVLAVIGLVDLGNGSTHVGTADAGCLAVSGIVALVIGLAQGRALRLESRDGALWGQLPLQGLWLWAALLASRVVMTLVAVSLGAHVASSAAAILLLLGINRLAQAAVVVRHAVRTGIPFAAEKDGSSFLAGVISPVASAQR